jgi:hypothetical protein
MPARARGSRHRDEHAEREVEGDEEAVERAPARREVRIEDAGESNRADVRARGAADEDPLPHVAVTVLPVVEARLRPRVRKVDEENEAEEDEDCGTDQCNVIAPDHEEAVGDDEGDAQEGKPEENLRSPPPVPIINGCRTATG